MSTDAGPHPYQDARLDPRNRALNLLSLMTLEEKVAQMGSRWIYELLAGQTLDRAKVDALLPSGIGQITRLAGASSLDPRGCAEVANALQHYLREETRLGIPAMIHEECCSGYTAQNATAFPQMIGLASTWQPELAELMTTEIRQQLRAVGAHQGLSPILDIGRDPRWGRIEETFGEDPHLVARMGVAYIEGLQGDSLQQGVVATVKHFVGYSVTEGGLNWAPAHLGERELHEVYLHPFEAAVKRARVRSLMAGYHELDGIPVSASRELMTELIRNAWGFDGVVVSDYMSINSLYEYHQYARDKSEASLMSLEAGVDLELPSTDCYGSPVLQAVADGRVPKDLIDRKGEGLAGTPMPETTDLDVTFVPMKTVLEAVRELVSEHTVVHYAQGCEVLGERREGFAEAVAAAERSEACIVVVGDKSGLARTCSTGEFRDRTTLTLPGVQEELVQAVVATGTPVVVVLVNGRPVSSPWMAEHVPAILEAWLPGEEGAPAIADALFGRVNPGGKLPVTVARNAGQVPIFYNHKPSGARSFPYGPYVDASNEPLYPFGFGLSYTRFELGDLDVGASELQAGESLTVSVTVTNTGERRGDEVVQLYTRQHGASVTRPVKELRAFQRLTLEPGQTMRIRFTLYANQLGFLDRQMNFVLEPGRLELMIGTSSEEIALRQEIDITGTVRGIGHEKVFFGN